MIQILSVHLSAIVFENTYSTELHKPESKVTRVLLIDVSDIFIVSSQKPRKIRMIRDFARFQYNTFVF